MSQREIVNLISSKTHVLSTRLPTRTCELGESVPIAREKQSFTKIVLDAVDEGMGFLDETGKAAMYYQVEKRFDLSRAEIPEKLAVFCNALEGLFAYGAKVIEFQIAKSLYEKLALRFEDRDDWALTDYAEYAEKKWQSHKTQVTLKHMISIFAILGSRLLNSITWIKPLPTYA